MVVCVQRLLSPTAELILQKLIDEVHPMRYSYSSSRVIFVSMTPSTGCCFHACPLTGLKHFRQHSTPLHGYIYRMVAMKAVSKPLYLIW
jgi:hypothetical protein